MMPQSCDKKPDRRIVEMVTRRYPMEAFHFVREGLSYTAKQIHDEYESPGDSERHISGQQLCLGLRDFAVEKYGLMAPAVLQNWKIKATDDFGHIVYAMIEIGLMSRTDEDTIDDFRSVYDMNEAFRPESIGIRYVRA